MTKKRKNKSKHSNLTISERKVQKRANDALERFKKRLRQLVNKTKVVWNGKPYSAQSTYDFQLHPQLTNMFVKLFMDYQNAKVDNDTLEAAQALDELDIEEAKEE